MVGCSWQQPMPAFSIPSPRASIPGSLQGRWEEEEDHLFGLAVDRRADEVILVLFHSLGGPSHVSENQWSWLSPQGDEEQVAVLVPCAEHRNARITSNFPDLSAWAQGALTQLSV